MTNWIDLEFDAAHRAASLIATAERARQIGAARPRRPAAPDPVAWLSRLSRLGLHRLGTVERHAPASQPVCCPA